MVPIFGHVQDEPSAKDWRWSDYAGSMPALASLGDLIFRDFAPPVGTQLVQDCCAWSVAEAAVTTACVAMAPIPFPSVQALYFLGRPLPLEDRGSSLRLMLDRQRAIGIVSRERLPEDPATVNEVPPLDALTAGQSCAIPSYYRIPAGPLFGDGVISALQRHRFPVFAIPVDEAFARIGSDVYAEQGGSFLGFHCMAILGYDSVRDAFLVLNSWGVDFGDRGYVWIARSLLARIVTDCWVLDVVPKGAA